MSNKAARLAEIYARIPKMIGCTGACHVSCGPIMQLGLMTPYEYGRLRDAPRLEHEELDTCDLLTADLRCSAYEQRPTVCRLWGTTPRMRCPAGCLPERWLTDQEGQALTEQVIALSGTQPFAFGRQSAEALAMIINATRRAR